MQKEIYARGCVPVILNLFTASYPALHVPLLAREIERQRASWLVWRTSTSSPSMAGAVRLVESQANLVLHGGPRHVHCNDLVLRGCLIGVHVLARVHAFGWCACVGSCAPRAIP